MGKKLNDWAMKVEDELKLMRTAETAEMQQWNKQSIYKIPECFTDLNKKAYMPQFFSFGPYHYWEPHLRPMEKHKRRALLHFLKKSRKPLASYVAALAEVAPNLKGSYQSHGFSGYDDADGFLMMMILDGCFMLEVLRTWTSQQTNDYSYSDPIFSAHGKLHVVPYIRRDMMMLENQLPMLLLTTLVAVENEGTQQDEESVNKLIREFCFPNPWFPLDSRIGKCLHLLDVYRSSLLREDTAQRAKRRILINDILNSVPFSAAATSAQEATGGKEIIPFGMDRTGGNEIIRSAMELSDAGIRFKKSRSASLNDISFTGGVLSLPPIVVDDTTESTFLNLIAFERFHVDFVGKEVTSYIFFMSKIIESAEDVSLLRARGIIKNALGSDNDVAILFNSLSKDLTLDQETSLYELHGEVNRYWKVRRVRVYLMKNYFKNPWAMLWLKAAVFLFFFTLAQTIISYHDLPAKN